jgi:hypothetical protein
MSFKYNPLTGKLDMVRGISAYDTRFLKIDGSNANTTINIGSQALTTTGTITGNSFIIGANTLTTSEFANLDGIDQTVATTSSPAFQDIVIKSVPLISHIWVNS